MIGISVSSSSAMVKKDVVNQSDHENINGFVAGCPIDATDESLFEKSNTNWHG